MNHKGLTIVELLAALVIMAIVATLVGMLINTYQNTNEDISETSKASLEATLLIQNIKDDLDDFLPTNYASCGQANCVNIIKAFEYVYDGSQIQLQVYDPLVSQNLIFENQQISFGSTTYTIESFTLSNDTSITYTENNGELTIHIDFTLVSDTMTYPFSMSYSYDIKSVPQQ